MAHQKEKRDLERMLVDIENEEEKHCKSSVVTLPFMIPDERKIPSTRFELCKVSKAPAISSGEEVMRCVLLRPARKGQ